MVFPFGGYGASGMGFPFMGLGAYPPYPGQMPPSQGSPPYAGPQLPVWDRPWHPPPLYSTMQDFYMGQAEQKEKRHTIFQLFQITVGIALLIAALHFLPQAQAHQIVSRLKGHNKLKQASRGLNNRLSADSKILDQIAKHKEVIADPNQGNFTKKEACKKLAKALYSKENGGLDLHPDNELLEHKFRTNLLLGNHKFENSDSVKKVCDAHKLLLQEVKRQEKAFAQEARNHIPDEEKPGWFKRTYTRTADKLKLDTRKNSDVLKGYY